MPARLPWTSCSLPGSARERHGRTTSTAGVRPVRSRQSPIGPVRKARSKKGVRMKYLVIAALVALVVGVSTALGGSAGRSHTNAAPGVRNGVIFACVETHGSPPTIGDIKMNHCNRAYKPLAWNIRGREGVPGPAGPQGPAGPAGPA